MKTNWLRDAVICFIVAFIALTQMSCAVTTWEDVEPSVGEYKLYSTIKVTEDWCYLDGQKVNGSIHYNTQVRSISTICISLNSDNVDRTIAHELDHAWRNAVGLDAKWIGH